MECVDTTSKYAHRTALGQAGEQAVADLIEGWGWQILDRNWRSPHGELDIVAMHGDVLIAVEVKTRTSLDFGHPAQAVVGRKLARLRRLVGCWIAAHGHVRFESVRIDVAAVLCRGDRFDCDYIEAVDR